MDINRLIIISFLKFALSSSGECSHFYGKTCPYVAAPVGRVPPCARPGMTYCEDPEGYPGELIMFLAAQARFNHKTLVRDETKDPFSATTGPYPAAKYPTSYKDIDITTSQPLAPSEWYSADDMYVPHTTNTSGNYFDGYSGYQDPLNPPPGVQFSRYKYHSNIPQLHQFVPSRLFDAVSDQMSLPKSSYFRTNFVWKRDVNALTNFHERVKRSESLRRQLKQIRESPFKKNFTGEVKYKRLKRQSNGDLEGEQLCEVRSNFIMPRAALNKDGVWMYVVNMEENNQKYTQLVRSEVCASQTCSSLCGLPNGYTSKCEQKYIQKRLIALQGQGDQLYTDIFWIPSCCVCTIRRN